MIFFRFGTAMEVQAAQIVKTDGKNLFWDIQTRDLWRKEKNTWIMLSEYVLKRSIYKAELESSPENFTSCEEKDKIKCPSSKLQFRNVLLGGLLGQQVTKSLPTNSLFKTLHFSDACQPDWQRFSVSVKGLSS